MVQIAIELATGYVSIVPSARGIGSKLASELTPALTTAGTNSGNAAALAFGAKFGGAMAAIGRRAALGLAAGFTLAGGFAIKTAADFQQTTIAFEGILGSADEAKRRLDALREFANKTPFEFPQLAKAAQQLLGVGFAADEIIPTMTTIGNTAAALGVGASGIDGIVRALGQMKGKGKASAQELNQISEAVPGFSAVGAIAAHLGVTTAEAFALMENGAVSADVGIEAILAGMERFPGAAGAMDRQSKTLNGVLSTFSDTLKGIAIDVITPYLPAISAAVQQLGVWLKENLPGFIAATVRALTAAVDFIRDRVIPAVMSVVKFFQDNQPALIALMGAIVALFVAWGVAALVAAAGTIVAGIAIVLLGATIALLVAGLIWAYQNVGWFNAAVDLLWSVLKAVGNWLVHSFIPNIELVGRVLLGLATFGMSEVVMWIGRHWDEIVDVITGLPTRITNAAVGMWDGIKEAFRGMINWIIDAWNRLDFALPEINAFGVHIGGQTFGVPDIPRLHTGGVFEAPRGQTEGLALLEDGETVLRNGAQGGGVVVNLPHYVGSADDITRVMDRWGRHQRLRTGLGVH